MSGDMKERWKKSGIQGFMNEGKRMKERCKEGRREKGT